MTLSGSFDSPRAGGGETINLFGTRISRALILGVVIGVAGIAGAGGLGYVLIPPVNTQVNDLKTQVQNIENEIRQKEAALADRSKVEAQFREAQIRRKALAGLFGEQKDVETLLLALNQQIRDTGATLKSFKPVPVTAKSQQQGQQGQAQQAQAGAEGQAEGQAATEASVEGLLKQLTYKVEFAGNYAQTLAVLRNIERLQVLLNVQGLSVRSATSRADEESGSPNLETSFDLVAYVPLTPEELKALQAQKAAAAEKASEKGKK
ncbi:MAG: hypothetical protein IGQ88_05015 [Gloeomargaritaceae cyanobacterium C42_A2020_066]|nr:hypothetical protein [Gloeomargaritaceae cyanobacterium C42_A2020_066]